jgi:hypothetical protein
LKKNVSAKTTAIDIPTTQCALSTSPFVASERENFISCGLPYGLEQAKGCVPNGYQCGDCCVSFVAVGPAIGVDGKIGS